jgi:acyl-coenzyme A thioesterase PaaI-like protein
MAGVHPDAFYLPDGATDDGAQRYIATGHSNGPWAVGLQHGGPPAALLGRALEQLPGDAERSVARVTVDLLCPVPVGAVSVSADVERPGRSVDLVSAQMRAGERVVARARAWRFAAQQNEVWTPATGVPAGPEHGGEQPRPGSWYGGYLDAVEWRWIDGAVSKPGPATVWMRPRVRLLPEEEMSPLQRLLTCADSASGASAALDPATWRFLNTELSVHLVRPMSGEWLCVDAETTLAGTSSGLAAARLLDAEGLVGRSAQALFVSRGG